MSKGFVVQKNGKTVSLPFATREEAQDEVRAYYAQDWQRSHVVTPTIKYEVVEVV
jgi:hypothetical protein